MKVYFNTDTFDHLIPRSSIERTLKPEEADFLVLGAKKVIYDQFTRLKAVYRFGVGSENVDFEYLKRKNIPVHFPGEETKSILYDATANFTVYGILKLLYDNAWGDVDSWKKKQRDFVGHQTALVIGTGNIGSRVAGKLKVFMKVESYDVCSNVFDELEPLVRKSDVITVHIPLTDQTVAFFNEEKLSWVKDGACLVNTARGDLFHEDALYTKLKNSNCRAFFDVFWQEPYKGKLKDLGPGKFLMSPHTASNTKEFVTSGFGEIVSILKGLAHE